MPVLWHTHLQQGHRLLKGATYELLLSCLCTRFAEGLKRPPQPDACPTSTLWPVLLFSILVSSVMVQLLQVHLSAPAIVVPYMARAMGPLILTLGTQLWVIHLLSYGWTGFRMAVPCRISLQVWCMLKLWTLCRHILVMNVEVRLLRKKAGTNLFCPLFWLALESTMLVVILGVSRLSRTSPPWQLL